MATICVAPNLGRFLQLKKMTGNRYIRKKLQIFCSFYFIYYAMRFLDLKGGLLQVMLSRVYPETFPLFPVFWPLVHLIFWATWNVARGDGTKGNGL